MSANVGAGAGRKQGGETATVEEDDEETDFMSWVLGDEAEEEKGAAAKVKRKAAPSKREEEDVAKAGRTKKKKKRAPMELEEGDIKLNCRDCKQTFAFTKGEQEFHAAKGFTNRPSRCKDCADKKKARMARRGENDKGAKQ